MPSYGIGYSRCDRHTREGTCHSLRENQCKGTGEREGLPQPSHSPSSRPRRYLACIRGLGSGYAVDDDKHDSDARDGGVGLGGKRLTWALLMFNRIRLVLISRLELPWLHTCSGETARGNRWMACRDINWARGRENTNLGKNWPGCPRLSRCK